jgi:hypothetical protein
MTTFSITFSIPESKVVKNVSTPKKRLLSPLIPGDFSTYIYNTEADYYAQYQESVFAVTTKKAGWDCMRHYEIIANGCIPYFPGLQECPKNTMALFPKHLVLKGNACFEKLQNKTLETMSVEEKNECEQLSSKLVQYMRNHLTTRKMAQYVLNTLSVRRVSSILYLSGSMFPDYLRCLTLHGFKELMGKKCHDYPKIPYLYTDFAGDFRYMYGKGITYSNLLNSADTRDDALDATIEQDIANCKYDLIIYGSAHRGLPFLELVKQHYSSERIIMFCGEDLHSCELLELEKQILFVRELE